jgi:hypothetical protein
MADRMNDRTVATGSEVSTLLGRISKPMMKSFIFIERIAILLAELTALAFFRIHSSFTIESRLLHIRNS